MERARLAVKERSREQFLKFLSSLYSITNIWAFWIVCAVLFVSMGFLAGINHPTGIVCLSADSLCYKARLIKFKKAVDTLPKQSLKPK